MNKLLFFAAILLFASCSKDDSSKPSTSGIISSIGGNGTSGFSGDGGAATNAMLSQPVGVAIDNNNNVYVADLNNNCIRKITPLGIITTVAGVGASGASGSIDGDGGPAIQAHLSYPTCIAVDSHGNLYIADEYYSVIRMVNTSGVINTIAGSGSYGYSGDGGPAILASLSQPTGIAVDNNGNIYIADRSNSVIRKIDPSGIITTFAGIAQNYGHTGDGGPASAATMSYPINVTLDGSGNLFIVDQNNSCIRKVDASGIITTVAGNGMQGYTGDNVPATATSLNYPKSVAVDGAGNLYIADAQNFRVRKVNPSGIISTFSGTGVSGNFGNGRAAVAAQLRNPTGVAVDKNGNIYIADQDDQRVRKVFK